MQSNITWKTSIGAAAAESGLFARRGDTAPQHQPATEFQPVRRPGGIGRHQPLLQQRQRRPAQPVGGQLDGAERRCAEGGWHDVIETQHRNILGHPDAGLPQGLQTAERQIVGGAENRGGVSQRSLLGKQTADSHLPHSGS